ncbi:hypothetical protein M501DRAFT_994603 [Patellaria atrata CBS 101060]|uniref:Uncharacterized protein n=1 Tax=Patellaria atrata CBS 101060 TaxID=1346257 RepID=A0A9P4SJF0_9PEZI|nr:hypothetical protein M501DRAFT_994603 [Patellaria atrata CBS 101060]
MDRWRLKGANNKINVQKSSLIGFSSTQNFFFSLTIIFSLPRLVWSLTSEAQRHILLNPAILFLQNFPS